MPTVPATVLSVTDGDTLRVRATPWIHWTFETSVRVVGIDTPEKGHRAKTRAEAALGERATLFAREQFPVGSTVRLSMLEDDKYGGRCLAAVTRDDGADWASLLIDAGLARPYSGGAKQAW